MDELKWGDCGVYKIVNKINGKVYIGSSCDVKSRWSHHRSDLCRGVHHNRYLQRAWDKYGSDAFEFYLVEKCSREERISVEQNILNTAKNNKQKYYNLSYDAVSGGHLRSANLTEKQTQELLLYWLNNGFTETVKYVNDTYGYGQTWVHSKVKEFKKITNKRPVRGHPGKQRVVSS